MITITRKMLAGREHLQVSVAAPPTDTVEAAAREALERAVTVIEAEGIPARHIVRSRLFARDAAVRQIAGAARLALLASERRGASSSYIDPDRLAHGSPLQVDLVALRAAPDAIKQVREYDPAIAPPMAVTLDGMLYLSGMTDTGPGLAGQATRIGLRIEEALTLSGARKSQVIGIDAFVARSETFDPCWSLVSDMFPGLDGGRTLSLVTGFSAETKRLEIETTARL